MNLFVVVLRYLVPIERIDAIRPSHVAFLNTYYEKGIFLTSGPQVPRTGGVILARAESRQALMDILQEDPFTKERCVEHQIFEFAPSRYSEAFNIV